MKQVEGLTVFRFKRMFETTVCFDLVRQLGRTHGAV